jgi:hypothetical protein
VIEGGCQCGTIRYRIRTEPLGLAVCHCRDCQKQSGSAFGMSLSVDPASFDLHAGSPKTFDVVCDSGRVKTCAFCPECGTRIYHRSENGLSVKAGTLDDAGQLAPDAHFWTARKQPWVVISGDVAQFEDDG